MEGERKASNFSRHPSVLGSKLNCEPWGREASPPRRESIGWESLIIPAFSSDSGIAGGAKTPEGVESVSSGNPHPSIRVLAPPKPWRNPAHDGGTL
jgi:hypothetical protein